MNETEEEFSNASRKERIVQGWLDFDRYHCQLGCIDKWYGNTLNHPDNPTEDKTPTETSQILYRCNEGEWIDSRELRVKWLFAVLKAQGMLWPAKRLFDAALINEI